MSTTNGLRLHVKAEKAREEDNHTEALKYIEEAIINYQKEGNYEGISKAIQSRLLTYKHLFLLTRDKTFYILAKKDAEASIQITTQHNLSNIISSCYFRLGEVAMLDKDYEEAIKNYQLALDKYRGINAEKGDYRYHLGEALYRKGDKQKGKQMLLYGLKEIQYNRNETDSFLIHVWESGCYMKLAELLRKQEPDKAKKYLRQAQEIAALDPKLIIRKRQIEEIGKSFIQ